MDKRFLLIIIVYYSMNLSAQELLLGAKTGIEVSDFSGNNVSISSFSMGIVAEYIPASAFFSLNTELYYLFGPKYLTIPLYLKAFFGDRIRPNIKGGLMPFFRLEPDDLNGPIGFGAMWGFGLDLRLGSKYFVFGGLDLYYIPFTLSYKYGTTGTSFELYPMLNIGLKYLIKNKATMHNMEKRQL